MKVLLIICASALAFCMVSATDDEDYCNIPGCEGQPHVACNYTGDLTSLSDKCNPEAELITLDDELKELFIDLHNQDREKIASGQARGYKTAARMGSVSWDDELAKLAFINLRLCNFEHDKCRSTRKFFYAGQNLAMSGSFPAKTVKEAITISVKMWFDERKNGDMSVINEFYSTKKTTGHFTEVVNERDTKIGCALLRTPQPEGPATEYYTTCNYARTNVLGERVYKIGIPASGCKTGPHPVYRSLCSTAEVYDV